MHDIIEEFIKEYNRFPTQLELDSLGVTRAMIRTEYGSLAGMKDVFASSEHIFDLERDNVPSLPKKKRYVITTAVTDTYVHEGFLNNIKAYCAKHDAALIIMPSQMSSKLGWVVDPILKSEHIVLSDTQLNDNVFLLGIKNSAFKVDPITGLPRVGKRNGTFICASPKQRLKYVATGVNKYPHALMSTGAITNPNYIKSDKLVDKSSYIANHDHTMGAIILELDENETFHFRQIQADHQGSFCDLGKMWKKGKEGLVPTTLVAGDWHIGSTDPELKAATIKLSDKLKIGTWIMHDVFDGESINHHEKDKLILLSKKAAEGKLSLDNEMELYTKELNALSKRRKLIIVRSNHDEFLDRYLDSGDYVKHPYNHRIALLLSLAKLDGYNPLEWWYKQHHPTDKNIRWLNMDESYKVGGVECGMHGHKGANGSRGSIGSMENAYGDVVYGHSHTPEIQRGAYCVGTSTYLQLSYNQGASSWMQTHALIYPNGQRQLINFINGKFSLTF